MVFTRHEDRGVAEELGMFVRHPPPPALDPHRVRTVLAGLVALLVVVALSAATFGILTWLAVRLVAQLFS
jgi:hypothetical protein